MVSGNGRKPSSPFSGNASRYKKVPKRVKEGGGGGCASMLILIVLLVGGVVAGGVALVA